MYARGSGTFGKFTVAKDIKNAEDVKNPPKRGKSNI